MALWAAGLAVYLLVPFLQDRTFTSFGHLVTLGIGFVLFPLTLAASVRRRRSMPIWAPPISAVEATRASILARREWRKPRREPVEHTAEDEAG